MLRRSLVFLSPSTSNTATAAAAVLTEALQRVQRRVPQHSTTTSSTTTTPSLQLRALLEEEGVAFHSLSELRQEIASKGSHLFQIVDGGGDGTRWGVRAIVTPPPPSSTATAGSSSSSTPSSSSSSSRNLLAALRRHQSSSQLVQRPTSSSSSSSLAEPPQHHKEYSVRELALQERWSHATLHKVLSSEIQPDLHKPMVHFRIRPKRPYRGAHVFIDGDGLRVVEVKAMWDAMRFVPAQSTTIVVRQPSTSGHSPADIVAPYGVSSYLLVEKQVQLLRTGARVVLKDVAYFCSDAQFDFYVEHVAPKVGFPDAAVFVCSPSAVTQIS